MMRELKQHGLSAYFFAFVLITMVVSLLIGGMAAGLAGYLMAGDPALMLFVPFASVIGGGFVIPIAILLWYAPSALIFSCSMAFLEKQIGTKRAIQCSGSITALVAAVITTYVATDFGRDVDGVGALMFLVGPVSVVIAPWTVRMAYNFGGPDG
ncbi:MAG: hypothetical protein QM656_15770 [Paracoccaceae bacterium]